MIKRALLALSFCLVALSAHTKVRVVATIHSLSLLVKDIGGEYVEVETLIPPSISVHLWEMTPKDLIKLQQSDLVVVAGCGAEPGLKVPKEKRIWALCNGTHVNPHMWLSLDKVSRRIFSLAAELSRLDLEHSEVFINRARQLASVLDNLKHRYFKRLAGVTVVSQHGAWVYLFPELGINYLGALEPAPHREPGPRKVTRLLEALNKAGCRIVVKEFGHNPRLADMLIKKTKACGAVLYPLGRGDEKSFEEFMRLNLDALLRCAERCTR